MTDRLEPGPSARARSSSRRAPLRNLGLLLASTALSLLFGESCIRWYEARFVFAEQQIGEEVIDLGALSFNDSLVPRRVPDGEYRVLGLGDSFAFGPVKNPFTYYAVAGRELDTLGRSKRFRFVNVGEPGISFYHYTSRYEYWRTLIEHDAAVFTVYLGNDFLDIVLGHARDDVGLNQGIRDLGIEVRSGGFRRGVPSRYPLRLLDYLRYVYLTRSGAVEAPSVTENGPYHSFALQLSEERYFDLAYSQLANFDPEQLFALRPGYLAMIRFVRFVSSVREAGTPTALVLAPTESQVSPALRAELAERYAVTLESYDLALSAFLIAETVRRVDPRIPVLDLTGPFEHGEKRGLDLYYGTNTHWSVDGNRLAGLCLADLLARGWFDSRLEIAGEMADLVRRPYGPMSAADGHRVRSDALVRFLTPLIDVGGFAVEKISPEELSTLARSSEATSYAIQSVNGRWLESAEGPDQILSVPVKEDGFFVAGWAVDSAATDLAGGVLIEINGKLYRSDYGLPREDVARSQANPRYRDCGFSLALAPEAVPPGLVELRALVVSGDGSSLYEGNLLRLRLEE